MNDERRTPHWLFAALNTRFDFELDAAATSQNALCDNYFTKEDSALVRSWGPAGTPVWCNPPYSRGNLYKFVHHAFSEPATTVMLVPGDCSTKVGQLILWKATAILFIDRRLKFDDESSGAMFASWIALIHGIPPQVWALKDLRLGVVR